MKTYRFAVRTTFDGPDFTDYFEFEDDVKDAELKKHYEEWVLWNAAKGGYTEVEQ